MTFEATSPQYVSRLVTPANAVDTLLFFVDARNELQDGVEIQIGARDEDGVERRFEFYPLRRMVEAVQGIDGVLVHHVIVGADYLSETLRETCPGDEGYLCFVLAGIIDDEFNTCITCSRCAS